MLTSKHILYLIGLQGISPFVLDSVINAALAYAMYRKSNELSLWRFPQPLAGDFAITTIVQCIITWLLVGIFVRRDIRVENISTIDLKGKYNFANRHMRQLPLNFRNKKKLWLTVKSILILIILTSIIFLLPSMIILGVIALNDYNADGKLTWEHMVIAKAVFGGSMALFINPLTAFFTLCSKSVAFRTSVALKNQMNEEDETETPDAEDVEDGYGVLIVRNGQNVSSSQSASSITTSNSMIYGMNIDEDGAAFETVVQIEINDEHL